MSERVGMVTGATGYIGGQVVQRLLRDGWRVRVLVRDADGLPEWAKDVEVVEGDASSAEDLDRALAGAEVGWYLIHSMGGEDDFAERDRELANAYADAAKRNGLSRIVYLGGLHPAGELSEHLASRKEVGEILMNSGVPTAAIQAGVVLGEGSASFDMLRTLSERLPGSIGPAWLQNRIQPIYVDDVVHYLVGAADLPAEQNRTFDVGGPDVLSYAEMMAAYADAWGLGPRPSVSAPVMTPDLAAQWIALVTPIEAEMAAPLVGSLVHDNVVKERDIDGFIGAPEGGLTTFRDAVLKGAKERDPWLFAKILGGVGAAVALTAAVGSTATVPGQRWFKNLDKPAWQPPNWLFGPVWSALYADIAVVSALHLADLLDAGKTDEAKRYAAELGLNLTLNAGWSWVFFRGHRLGASTVVAAALAASSAGLVARAAKRPQRGVVLAPYAGWTAFATALTAELWRRNR